MICPHSHTDLLSCRTDNIGLSLQAHAMIRYLWEIEDSKGELPTEPNQTYTGFVQDLNYFKSNGWFRTVPEFAVYTLLDLLDSDPDIGIVLETIVDKSTDSKNRLLLAEQAKDFFKRFHIT